jgi:hypothetical protein
MPEPIPFTNPVPQYGIGQAGAQEYNPFSTTGEANNINTQLLKRQEYIDKQNELNRNDNNFQRSDYAKTLERIQPLKSPSRFQNEVNDEKDQLLKDAAIQFAKTNKNPMTNDPDFIDRTNRFYGHLSKANEIGRIEDNLNALIEKKGGVDNFTPDSYEKYNNFFLDDKGNQKKLDEIDLKQLKDNLPEEKVNLIGEYKKIGLDKVERVPVKGADGFFRYVPSMPRVNAIIAFGFNDPVIMKGLHQQGLQPGIPGNFFYYNDPEKGIQFLDPNNSVDVDNFAKEILKEPKIAEQFNTNDPNIIQKVRDFARKQLIISKGAANLAQSTIDANSGTIKANPYDLSIQNHTLSLRNNLTEAKYRNDHKEELNDPRIDTRIQTLRKLTDVQDPKTIKEVSEIAAAHKITMVDNGKSYTFKQQGSGLFGGKSETIPKSDKDRLNARFNIILDMEKGDKGITNEQIDQYQKYKYIPGINDSQVEVLTQHMEDEHYNLEQKKKYLLPILQKKYGDSNKAEKALKYILKINQDE